MVLDNMCDRPYEAHRFITNYYNVYCSLTAGLYEMSSMPLDISRILLASPQQDFVKPTAGFFRRVAFSVQKFFGSFVEDYSAVTSADGREKAITLWVNWGPGSGADSQFTDSGGLYTRHGDWRSGKANQCVFSAGHIVGERPGLRIAAVPHNTRGSGHPRRSAGFKGVSRFYRRCIALSR